MPFKEQMQAEYKILKAKKKRRNFKKNSKVDNILTLNLVEKILFNYSKQIHTMLVPSVIRSEELQNTQLKMVFESGNIYIQGRYNKLNRRLSQTPWEVNGLKIYESSLEEELIGPFLKYFKPKRHKFHSGGREDVDVRMLGAGRPFVVELISPQKRIGIKQEILDTLMTQVNDPSIFTKCSYADVKIHVRGLKMVDNTCFKYLSQSAKDKAKAYAAIVKFERAISDEDVQKLNSFQDLVVRQKTPLRVLHRRTLMFRDKVIYKMHFNRINSHWFVAFMLTSAGTYVKEFVHGDLGRTMPYMGSLIGTTSDIFQLDVLEIYETYGPEALEHFKKMAVQNSFKFNKTG